MNVLLVRAGALGDILLLRRAVATLKAAGHAVALLAPSASGAALVGPGPTEAERVIGWDRPEAAALLTADGPPPGLFRDELLGFDLALCYSRSQELAAGLGGVVPEVRTHAPQPEYGHAADWLASPLAGLGLYPSRDEPAIVPTRDEQQAAQPWLDRLPSGFLAVHPGSGSKDKNWPAERFATVVLERSRQRPWLLVEGPADAQAADVMRAIAPDAVTLRELPPRVLGAVLARSGAYLGNDSGVSHLAAAWGAPTVALFGPTDPAIWSPVGPSVRALRSTDATMTGFTTDRVVEALAAVSPPSR